MNNDKLTVDNRDKDEMIKYLEARVEIMRKHIRELEHENSELRAMRTTYKPHERDHTRMISYLGCD